MYSHDELFLRSLECYFGVYLNTKITLMSAETVRHSSTYIILHVRFSSHVMLVYMDEPCKYSFSNGILFIQFFACIFDINRFE